MGADLGGRYYGLYCCGSPLPRLPSSPLAAPVASCFSDNQRVFGPAGGRRLPYSCDHITVILWILGFTNLSSMPYSDLGCWVSYEDTRRSPPRAEHRPSVPGCGGGAEAHAPLAFGHSLLPWRRADGQDDRAVRPNPREPGPRCPALRGLSALGLASGGARAGAGRVLSRRHV